MTPEAMVWNAPRVRAWRRRVGWPVALALLAVAGTAWIQGVRLPAVRAEAQALRAAVAPALRRAEAAAAARPGVATEASAAERFQAAFPPATERHARLRALLAQAHALGVALPRTESRWQADRPLSSFEIGMSMQADYAALRAFVEAALAADPALSLDGVRLQRSSRDASRVDADMRWALHSRGESGNAPTATEPVSGARP